MDHDLMALTPCTIGFIAHSALKALNVERPNVAAALWRESLVDAAIFREWVVNVRRRSANPGGGPLLVGAFLPVEGRRQGGGRRVRISGHAERSGRLSWPVGGPHQPRVATSSIRGACRSQPVAFPAAA